ncbi:MAG: PEFG-CTERM sorting domain-containing protein [Thaumarchaeota archaeon]|nr:PEFG-CTERM sorting domain-containing protein [Nitrososphaerota archaeon]
MRTVSTFALTAIILAGAGTAPALAQQMAPIAVMTDMESYVEGDVITISGQVMARHSGGMSIIVTAPNGNIVKIGQPMVGPDNTFTFEIATGNYMTQAGIYTVEANYSLNAKSPRLATTTFMYTPIDTSGIFVDGTEFEPAHTIVGGAVLGMHTDPQYNTLVIDIESMSDGTITITLPRALIDSQTVDGTDDSFFVLVDGEEVDYMETETTDEARTLVIDFPGGAEMIEIIGTSVAIPEFGVMAALILAVAIVSIVAVSARSRLSLVPRF